MDNIERELGWDSEIEKESDFVILPEGDYNFTVKSFTRGRHAGSAKLPACNKAILSIELSNGTDNATIEHNLFLHSKCEGILSAFFIAIGQKKHGEPLKMDWTKVTGATGKCKVYIDNWTSTNGNQMQSNKIKRFLEPSANDGNTTPQKTPQPSFTPGDF